MTETITEEHLIAAYRSCLTAPGSELVLRDLVEFCRAAMSCAVAGDHDQTMINEGRREVFLRIQNFMNLTADELVVIRAGRMRKHPERHVYEENRYNG